MLSDFLIHKGLINKEEFEEFVQSKEVANKLRQAKSNILQGYSLNNKNHIKVNGQLTPTNHMLFINGIYITTNSYEFQNDLIIFEINDIVDGDELALIWLY